MTTALLESSSSHQPPVERFGYPPIHVLHLINGEHYAGAERVQDLLAQSLGDEGFAVSFACVKPLKFPAARRSQHAPLFAVPMRSKFDLRPARALVRLIRQERFALVHTHTPRTAMLGRLASFWAGVPMVHHVHGHTASEVGGGCRHRFYAWVEGLSLRGAAKIVAVSESSADYMIQQGITPERLTVVPNGIPPRPLIPARSARPASGRWASSASSVRAKGLEVLLRTLARLRRQGRAVRLRAVGPFETPGYEEEIRRLAAELQVDTNVDWRGFQSDVAAELAAMDLFVFPSILPEGMPMVLLEAMAAGVPIIGTTVDGVTDVLRHGHDGLLTAPGDAADVAAAVTRITSEPGAVARAAERGPCPAAARVSPTRAWPRAWRRPIVRSSAHAAKWVPLGSRRLPASETRP